MSEEVKEKGTEVKDKQELVSKIHSIIEEACTFHLSALQEDVNVNLSTYSNTLSDTILRDIKAYYKQCKYYVHCLLHDKADELSVRSCFSAYNNPASDFSVTYKWECPSYSCNITVIILL